MDSRRYGGNGYGSQSNGGRGYGGGVAPRRRRVRRRLRVGPTLLLVSAVAAMAFFFAFGGFGKGGQPYIYEDEWRAAVELADEGLHYQALTKLGLLLALPEAPPAAFLAEFEAIKAEFYGRGVSEAGMLISQGKFSEANSLALELEEFFPQDPRVANLIFSSSGLVRYSGAIEHIFFHPLMVYAELGWSGIKPVGSQSALDTREQELITVYEFKKILENLYANDFVIIDINMIYSAVFDKDGGVIGVTEKELWLPKGKKPLVISVDDINYYQNKLSLNGWNWKLILDEAGELAAYSKAPDGSEVVSRDNEIVTILDSFVLAHPDFSFNNSKGCLALTGYDGVLGWRIKDPAAANYAEELAGCREVVAKLKENGWTFASHGYAHIDMNKATYEQAVSDTERWLEVVGSVVGPTSVYIYPYGDNVGWNNTNAKLQALQKSGFAMFCGVYNVQPGLWFFNKHNYVFQERRLMGGPMFFPGGRGWVEHMIDVDDVRDPARPSPPR
ncbi:MAG: polysaccharide deacetylase family protein [Clostridiales bacterium]|nr:polysaccharide deacetylase family protein [Clostridiales bacterium]